MDYCRGGEGGGEEVGEGILLPEPGGGIESQVRLHLGTQVVAVVDRGGDHHRVQQGRVSLEGRESHFPALPTRRPNQPPKEKMIS
jgi:hypothetical protein